MTPTLTAVLTGTRRLVTLTGLILMVAATAHAQTNLGCIGNAPQPLWVCVNGGWVPPNHPLALNRTPTPPPVSFNCNPYDLDMLANSPACEPFRRPHVTAPQAPVPFQVGQTYQSPYISRLVVTAMLIHQTGNATAYWVGECLNDTGPECTAVGQTRTLELQDSQLWMRAPAQP